MRKNFNFGKESRRKMDFGWLPGAISWLIEIIIVCVFAFIFVWYFGQRVSTIGDSMNPVLNNGDVVLVNRIIYDASSPKRGDVIVFRPNGNENIHFYIKRIVGLPGETIQIKDGQILIDGEVIEEKYETTELVDAGLAKDEIILGGDEFFVLGDNRENSEDSRMADIGNVKRSEIEGKAWLKVWPASSIGRVK